MKNTGDPNLSNVHSKIDTGNKKRTKSYGRKNILEKEKGKDLFGGEKQLFKESTNKKKKKTKKSTKNNNNQEEEKSNLNTNPYTINNNYSDLNTKITNEEVMNPNLNNNNNSKNLNNSNFNKSINSKSNLNNNNDSKVTFNNINNINNNYQEIDYSNSIINEKKTKDSLKRLISTSHDLLNQQNNILAQCDEFAKNVTLNDFEIERVKMKQETDNFPEVVKNYTKNLGNILEKLRKTSKDIDESRKLREENNSLKYKIQMLSIDKSDDYLNIESQLTSARNIYANEMNSMINFFHEIGLDNNPIEKVTAMNFSEDKIISFFALVKKHMKDMKNKIDYQDEKIKDLSNENNQIKQRIDNINMKTESLFAKNNIDLHDTGNNNFNINPNNYGNFNEENKQFITNNSYNNLNSNTIPSNYKNYEETKKIFPNNNFDDIELSNNNPNYNSKLNNQDQFTYNYNYNPIKRGIGESQNFISNTNTNQLINEDDNHLSTQNLIKSNSIMNSNYNNFNSQNEISYIDNFKRSKDLKNDFNPNNLDLQNKYTDSYFYSSNENYPRYSSQNNFQNTNTSQLNPKFN